MITLKELLSGHSIADVELSAQINLEELLKRINKLRAAYNKPLIVTSGYRSKQDQLRIYRSRNIPDNKIPMGSAHITGCACDIYDPNGELMEWSRNNENLLEEFGLWVEDDTTQPRVHYQTYPPKSGKRFFKP